jgi:hypothetical protein
LTHAKENNYGYLVFPTILEWEDRATEWSGIPDKASIKIAMVVCIPKLELGNEVQKLL